MEKAPKASGGPAKSVNCNRVYSHFGTQRLLGKREQLPNR